MSEEKAMGSTGKCLSALGGSYNWHKLLSLILLVTAGYYLGNADYQQMNRQSNIEPTPLDKLYLGLVLLGLGILVQFKDPGSSPPKLPLSFTALPMSKKKDDDKDDKDTSMFTPGKLD